MEHSKNYNKIKRWYDMGMWNETRVRNFFRREPNARLLKTSKQM